MIYLDHNATTPVLPEVFVAMQPYFCEEWGNLLSIYKCGSKLEASPGKRRGSGQQRLEARLLEVMIRREHFR